MTRASAVVTAGLVLLAIGACRSAGTAGSTEAPQPVGALPGDVTPAMISLGDSLFNSGACRRCHGQAGAGGNNGPSLTTGAWLHGAGTFENLVSTITTGVPRDSLRDSSRRFAMNPRGGPMQLTDDQVRAIAAYVHTISRSKTVQ
jgi:mono/diheme cytochrome c family protein